MFQSKKQSTSVYSKHLKIINKQIMRNVDIMTTPEWFDDLAKELEFAQLTYSEIITDVQK